MEGAVANFICRRFGVQALHEVNPFGEYPHEAWELMRQTVVVGVEVSTDSVKFERDLGHAQSVVLSISGSARLLGSALPHQRFFWKNDKTAAPLAEDMNAVSVFSIVARAAKSTLAVPVAGRLNFYHRGLNAHSEQSELDAVYQQAGAVPGSYIRLLPSFENREADRIAIREAPFSYTNEHFTGTMALIGEDNLENGIIRIPRDVCQEAGLPVFSGKTPELDPDQLAELVEKLQVSEGEAHAWAKNRWIEAIKGHETVDHFVALPINHVLAWPLRSDLFRKQSRVRCEQLCYENPFTKEPVLLYYLVGDVTYRQLLSNFRDEWMNKVDVRPLDSIAWEFVPEFLPEVPFLEKTVEGSLMMRSYLKYMVPPVLTADLRRMLAPTIRPGFPECALWIRNAEENAKQSAAEQIAAKIIGGRL